LAPRTPLLFQKFPRILATNRRNRPLETPIWMHLIESQKVAAPGLCLRGWSLGWRGARSRPVLAIRPQYVVVFGLTDRQISCKLGHPEIVEMSQERLEKWKGEACSTGRVEGASEGRATSRVSKGASSLNKRFSRGLERGHQQVSWRSKAPFLWGRAPAIGGACCGKFKRLRLRAGGLK
jgi:hypothetical protein